MSRVGKVIETDTSKMHDGLIIMRPDYTITRGSFHYCYSAEQKPILRVKTGDIVKCEVSNVSNGQITKNSTAEDIPNLDRSKMFPLTGPIYIEGAKVGDSLVVDILSVKASGYGFSMIEPRIDPFYRTMMEGATLHNYLHIWDLSNGRYARFKKRIRVPIRPFCGTIGVAPEKDADADRKGNSFVSAASSAKLERNSVDWDLSAWKHGVNMDIRYLTDGSKLILPICVDGALFSCGDLHAAQGDGELGSAIESNGEITVRFALEKKSIPNPRFITSKRKSLPEEAYFSTTGNAPDLMTATRQAAKNMIQYLKEFDLTTEEAYMLCGVAADLHIHQCVNAPNFTVGLMMPTSVLGIH